MRNTLSKTLETVRIACLRIASRHRLALCRIPPGLYEYWARTAHIEFKGIPRDAFFYARAADALLTFFECVRRSNRPCALPSKAADSVWHAWLRYSPASLDDFCEWHFGRHIPHVEAGDMAGGMALPMATALITARRLEGLDVAGPNVPRLFGTDRALRMPGGFAYEVRGSRIVLSHMSKRGLPARQAHVHPATEPDFLLAAGLIAQRDHDRWQSRYGRTAGSGSAGVSTGDDVTCCIATTTGDCDSSGSDTGGSGCGSSCGGGCGGGGCGS
jgi:hypothetical protein